MEKLLFVGDLHGEFRPLYDIIHRHPGSTLVQVGDFGVLDPDEAFCRSVVASLDRICAKHQVSLHVIRGNHDNPAYFRGKTRLQGKQVTLHADYTVVELCGKRIGLVGGATSIDRMWRSPGIGYYADEVMVWDEARAKALENLDILVTHSTDERTNPCRGRPSPLREMLARDARLAADLAEEDRNHRRLIDHVVKTSPNLAAHFYGHFHVSAESRAMGFRSRCVAEAEVVAL